MGKAFLEEIREAEIERLKNDESLRQLKPEMISQMELENERICYFPPKNGEECKQKLIIMRGGKVTLTHFYYSGDFIGSDDDHREHSIEEWSVENEIVNSIYKRTLDDFKYFSELFTHDVGSWTLRLRIDNGECFERRCSRHTQPKMFSEYLRVMLNREDLYVCE